MGKHLRELRIAKGFSQEKPVLSSKLDRSYIVSVDRGQRNLGPVNMLKLATVLTINPKEPFS